MEQRTVEATKAKPNRIEANASSERNKSFKGTGRKRGGAKEASERNLEFKRTNPFEAIPKPSPSFVRSPPFGRIGLQASKTQCFCLAVNV